MSFSLRLTADLTLALTSRALGIRRDSASMLRLSPGCTFDLDSYSIAGEGGRDENDSSHSGTSRSSLPRNHSAIIWIGGAEPLDYPGAALLSNSLAAAEHHVFLETCGASLKPRLHEFQPSSRFYFVIRFDDGTRTMGQSEASERAFRVELEAIRMARLAGFFTCANLVLQPETTDLEIERLNEAVHKLDVDGCLITQSDPNAEPAERAGRLRRRLLNRRCALLCSLLDASAAPFVARNSLELGRPPLQQPQRDSLHEGAEAG
ncbi:MAG: radical SAM protein [Candidatus Acidiferrum sp.]